MIKYVNENRLDKLNEDFDNKIIQRMNQTIKEYLKTGYLNEDLKEAKWIRFVIRVNHGWKRELLDEKNESFGEEWLRDECIKQAKFCRKIEPYLAVYDYKKWKKSYCKFLDYCRKTPNVNISPTLIQDFMWHAHLQDYFNYKSDCEDIVGRVITHNTQNGSDDDSIKSDMTTCSSSDEVISSDKIKRYYGFEVNK